MTAQNRLRRQVSCLFERGWDPYNTADTIRVSLEASEDFVRWASQPAPADDGPGDGHLRSRQAD